MSATRQSQQRRPGFALIDAVLALAILALAAAGIIALLRQTTLSLRMATDRDRTARTAGMVLASVVIRDRAWMDAHLGSTRYGNWMLDIEQLTPSSLHAIALRDTASSRVWVATTVYIPQPKDSVVAP